jgi:hypothetical protein
MDSDKQQFLRILVLVTVFTIVVAAAYLISDRFGDASRQLAAPVNFAELSTADANGRRYFITDERVHTVLDIETTRFRCGYAHVLDLGKRYFDGGGRLLLIGLGGGSVARSYALDGWRIDAVEPDTEITAVARSKLALGKDDARVHATTALNFLVFQHETYDAVVIDAFGSRTVPVEMLTREGLGAVAERITKDGIVMLNLAAVGWKDEIVCAVAATLESHFEHVLALPMAEPPNTLGYVILFASNRPLEPAEDPPTPFDRMTPAYDRFHAWENRFKPDTAEAKVITDRRNPVRGWLAEIKAAGGLTLDETRDFPGTAP